MAVWVSRVTYSGTNEGPFRELPATGRRMSVSGIDVFRFAGGKVVQHWHEATT